MTYRPEIDGLRTLAILLVLLCHMQLGAPGGFIGVDIFFVISGYLITGILLKSLDEQHFSFLNFYARRFIRLYPALLAMVLLTFFAGCLIADPVTLANIARTSKYVLASTSNIFFYHSQGYFDVSAHKQIFLHTWSLGVEWQFYLLWPLIIWFIYKISAYKTTEQTRQRKHFFIFVTLIIITSISVIASQKILNLNPMAAYYLMPYRAFELGIGGLLIFIEKKLPLKPTTGATLTFVGIGTILFAALKFTPQTPFPGVNGLLIALATAFCILGSHTFTKGNLLKWPTFVLFGKASYSIYLVHWPILVLYSYYVYRPLILTERILLLLISILLGMALYFLVERKINWKHLSQFKGGTLTASLSMLAIIAILIPTFHYINKETNGLQLRLGSSALNQSDYFTAGRHGYAEFSTLGMPNTPPIAVIAGDSFAHSYATGIDEALRAQNQAMILSSRMGCLISGLYYQTDFNTTYKELCINAYQNAFDIAQNNQLPVVLIQSWADYIKHENGVTSLIDGQIYPFRDQAEYDHITLNNLRDLHQRMNGRPLILVATLPYYKIGFSEKECLARPDYIPNTACQNQITLEYNATSSVVEHVNTILQNFAANTPDVYYINPQEIACPQGKCTAMHNAMLYDDGSHLSKFGSRLLGTYVVAEIQRILTNKPEH